MRMHIDMDDELVADVDAVAGRRGRSRFVREAVLVALDQRKRADLIRAARGSVIDEGHDWDDDPARWVRRQRRTDRRRTG
ncbi:MAG TPA: hypothetical protein VK988_06325 [Acidimicrobiales bacterium]|nr:hypothetical protein [Acidimicrobiales bacterium]